MKKCLGAVLTFVVLLSAQGSDAKVDWKFEEGDAYSRVVCRDASDTEGARKEDLYVLADATGRGPALSCRIENYEIVLQNDLLTEDPIPLEGMVWGPRKNGVRQRRYFVVPEVCFEVGDKLRCRKQAHAKTNTFQIDLPSRCPYRVKISATPIVTTDATNLTRAPLQPPGTMLLEDGALTSNPFSFHRHRDIDGAYYRDLATVRVTCLPEPRVPSATCGNGAIDAGEVCDDGNSVEDDGCTNQCEPSPLGPFCGDGNVDAGEACDDGNLIEDDGCSNNCFPPISPPAPTCGDGAVQPAVGETCEVGMVLAPVDGGVPARTCRDDCSYCGDGLLDGTEECDDGNDAQGDGCSNECVVPPDDPPAYRFCEMFRDPSFSRDQQGNARLKANGRMEAIDVTVAGPSDDLVVDLGQETVVVQASTPQEGVVFEREFPIGSLSYFERSGNHGWEHDDASNDFMTLRINNNYSRFNLELPGDDRMDALLDKVEAGQVRSRLVEFQIRFEEERIICRAETWWACQDTGARGHCKGLLQ
ncbi:MAG: DUF4215 domain-containing protein [Candidatus Binatia bacterium]|nr:DUF4215 domain-containing protein [Candidatus Binatia bacterium]